MRGADHNSGRAEPRKGVQAVKLILNPEYQLYEKDGKPFCDSLQVAETFGKEHGHVLRDIRDLECSNEFRQSNFGESNYKSRGKSYPKYLITKDGFTMLAMGYAGKKAMAFKEAYINRFNQMEAFIQSLLTSKMEFPAFTEAVMLAHGEPKHYHYSNEINMIYRIVLGMDAKKFREQSGIPAGDAIKPHLAVEQLKAIETLQRIDIGLMEAGLGYEERKEKLTESYRRRLRLLAG